MRNIKKILSLATVFLLFQITVGHSAIKTGETAPEFTLIDTYEAEHSLSNYKGKFVVLEWLNHDCPFVRKHYGNGNMQSLQKTYTEKEVIWLSISSSAHGNQGHYHPEEANQLTQEKQANPTAVLLDIEGTVGHLYGAKTTPHIFIINPEGTLIYQGAIDSIPGTDPADIAEANNYVQLTLDAAMAGNSVATPSTQSYGCSVKY